MLYIGIDPGINGGIAALGKSIQRAQKIPTIGTDKKTIDLTTIVKWLYDLAVQESITCANADNEYKLIQQTTRLVVIEKVSAMPKQGVTSMFSFGRTVGMLMGLVLTLKLPLIMPTPQTWKKLILEGTAKDKDAAIQYVRQKYPNISLRPTDRCTSDHDGIADAVCLAEYGMKQSNTEL